MQEKDHTSKHFDAELQHLRGMVLSMGRVAEQQIRYSVEALRGGDEKLVSRVITEEARLNALEREIDEYCATVLARRTPTANDLRLVLTTLKISTELERVGDEAKKLAFAAGKIFVGDRMHSPSFADIRLVGGVVTDMLHRALDGFARLEPMDAPEIVRLDEEVDQYFRAILRQLLTYMIEDPRTISPALEVVFIAKALERIGDHAKNIAKHVVYLTRGEDVRHLPVERIEQAVRP
ncbi:MAG: phosphate signaling complex protein PhoU [Burkholderiales bacterium]